MTITILTGAPGVGKSTAVLRAARALKDRGLNVGGIVSKELRTSNIRV
jgi:nucleoside-triphosphatase